MYTISIYTSLHAHICTYMHDRPFNFKRGEKPAAGGEYSALRSLQEFQHFFKLRRDALMQPNSQKNRSPWSNLVGRRMKDGIHKVILRSIQYF